MGRAALHHKRRNQYHAGSGQSTPQSILGGNLRLLFDARSQASSASWVDQIQGITATGANSPSLAAEFSYYRGRNVLNFNGTNQTFDTGAIGFDIVPAGGAPYMWVVGRHAAAPGGGTTTRMVVTRTPGVEEQLGLGDIAGNATTNGFFTGNVTVGTYPAPQGFPAFWEIFYDVGGARTVYRNGVLLATGAVATTAQPIRRVMFGGRADLGTAFAKCSLAQIGVCTTVPTTAQRAALFSAAVRDWDVGDRTLAQFFGSQLADYWDSGVGVSTGSSWTSVARGIVIGGGAPHQTVAADGTNFRGKNVAIYNGVDQVLQNSNISPALLLAGTRPHMWMVGRSAAATGGAKIVMLADVSVNSGVEIALGASGIDGRINNTAVATLAAGVTSPHFLELFFDNSGVLTFASDGTTLGTTGTGQTLGANQAYMTIGGRFGTTYAPAILAQFGYLNAPLTAAQRGVLRAMMQESWNVP